MSADFVQVHKSQLELRPWVERFVHVLVRGDSVRKVMGLHLEIDSGDGSVVSRESCTIPSGDFRAPDICLATEFFPNTIPPEPVPNRRAAPPSGRGVRIAAAIHQEYSEL